MKLLFLNKLFHKRILRSNHTVRLEFLRYKMSNKQQSVKGWLEKWGKRQYYRRWIELVPSTCTIKYFEFEPKSDDEGINPKKQRTLKDTIIVDTDNGKEDILFYLIDIGGKEIWYFKAATPQNKRYWLNHMANGGAKEMTPTEYTKFTKFGELIPALNFPTLRGNEALSMRKEEKSMLDKISANMATVVENGAKAGLSILPLGGLFSLAGEGVILLSAKVYHLLQKSDLSELENHLEEQVDRKIFKSNMARLQSELSTIEERYKLMLNKDLTDIQKQTEVQIAMHNFEAIIRLFQEPDIKFLENSFIMSPFLTSFSSLYLAFVQSAILVLPVYKSKMVENILALESCLEMYKKRAIEQRITGITMETATLSSYYDKVVDEKYPSNVSGVRRGVAYVDFAKHDSSEQFYKNYKTNVLSLYTNYFDDVINDFQVRKNELLQRISEIEAYSTKPVVIDSQNNIII